ncbi:hypothetical protein M2388_000414 [Leucobacter aridicollis]|nr:hypothetical protein [Leucobacter aridicollis]
MLKSVIAEAVTNAVREGFEAGLHSGAIQCNCGIAPTVMAGGVEHQTQQPRKESDILTKQQTAAYLQVSVRTLDRWEETWPDGECLGPPVLTLRGLRARRYRMGDVWEWLGAG